MGGGNRSSTIRVLTRKGGRGWQVWQVWQALTAAATTTMWNSILWGGEGSIWGGGIEVQLQELSIF